MCPKLKTLFNIQPVLTTVKKSHTKNLEKLTTKPIDAKTYIHAAETM